MHKVTTSTETDQQAPTASASAEWQQTATVSVGLIEDWLHSLRAQCAHEELSRCLQEAGIVKEFLGTHMARLTHDQVVSLYQKAAASTGDEMMGLWSRPIRTGSLKTIIRAIIDAPNINVALYRFTKVWNLLLDDYSMQLSSNQQHTTVALVPYGSEVRVNRFGHTLILKLTHGIVSWLVGREVPVAQVALAFAQPDFAADYPVLFPGPVRFGSQHSSISFSNQLRNIAPVRSAADVRAFLVRAPRDWIFTSYSEHALKLKVRELLHADLSSSLDRIAKQLCVSPRTLIRQLRVEGLSFQTIKDELRRDIALLHLSSSDASLTAISDALKFSNSAVFHRAFRNWTGMTPGAYRLAQRKIH